MDIDTSVREVELHKLLVRGAYRIAGEYLLDAKVDAEKIGREYALNIAGFVWGFEKSDAVVEVPDGWWQAFKDEVLRKVLPKLRVRTRTYQADAKAYFPEIRFITGHGDPRLRLAIMQKVRWTDGGA